MKKKILFIALLAATFAACDPIEDSRDTMSGNVSDLKLTCTPISVDGKKSNEIIVENNSPLLSSWVSDRSKVQSAYTTLLCDYVGTRNIQFTGLNGDGTKVEKTIAVKVDTMTNLTSETISRLGIVTKSDGSVDKTSMPYYWGCASYNPKITITQEKSSTGKKGNKLTIKCDAPYLCDWTFGDAKSNKNSCELFVTSTGTFNFSLKFTKSDGSVVENAYTDSYVVEELTTIPAEYTNLFGDFIKDPTISKTWQWNRKGKVWANGPLKGFTDPGSGWWQNEYSDMTNRQDGKMTFKFADLSLTKEVTGGDAKIEAVGTYTGHISVDLGTKTSGYSVGTIKLNGISILYGVDVNAGNVPFTSVSLVKVTDKTLILGGDSEGTGQTWLYKFEKVE